MHTKTSIFYLFLRTMFGPIYYVRPRNNRPPLLQNSLRAFTSERANLTIKKKVTTIYSRGDDGPLPNSANDTEEVPPVTIQGIVYEGAGATSSFLTPVPLSAPAARRFTELFFC